MRQFNIMPNNDGTCDIIVEYGKHDVEFAKDFMSSGSASKGFKSLADFISQNSKNIRVKAVRIVIAGAIIATIPFSALLKTSAATSDSKFAMAYLYGGTATQQIEYVKRTNNAFQTVSPSYFDINIDGSLKLNTISTELVNTMHANGIKVVPFLSNHWDRNAGILALQNVEKLSTQIANYIEQYNLDGVNVDIENVTDKQRAQYSELVRLLRKKVPANKEVSVAVAANPKNWQTGWHGSYDYSTLASNSDYLMMMTYDEHYEGGAAGPVASISWVEQSIKYALSQTSSDKIVVGLPFFGRVWSTSDTSMVGKGVSIAQINEMVKEYNGKVTFDTASQSPKAEFEVKTGDKQFKIGGKVVAPGKYVVWYENEQSFEAKLKLVRQYDLKGAGSWALGQEDASIWNSFDSWLNGESSQIQEPSSNIIYSVQAGDSLWLIAQKFKVTVSELKTLNKLTSDTINVGQKLQIPNQVEIVKPDPIPTPPTTPVKPPVTKPPTTTPTYKTHTVVKGDTLWKIAQKYKITVSNLKTLNGLKGDSLKIGQKLKVTGSAVVVTPPTAAYKTHTVVKGDTLWKISQKYKMTVSRLKTLNGLKGDSLKIGQKLKVNK